MDEDIRHRFLYSIEESMECEREAKAAANKKRLMDLFKESSMDLYEELSKLAKEEEN